MGSRTISEQGIFDMIQVKLNVFYLCSRLCNTRGEEIDSLSMVICLDLLHVFPSEEYC